MDRRVRSIVIKMLWYKGWLETRIRLSVSLGYVACLALGSYALRGLPQPPGANVAAAFGSIATIVVVVVHSWLAGAGIATQPAFQASKGLHGSTLFTLSLPVSRFRLLVVRAGIGWLELACVIAALCAGMWLFVPRVRGACTAAEMFEFAVALVACASALYFLSVFLASFVDDLWRMAGGALFLAALWLLSKLTLLPASVDLVRAMLGSGSPLVAHTMPWNAMVFSLALSAILFLAALKIVQRREY